MLKLVEIAVGMAPAQGGQAAGGTSMLMSVLMMGAIFAIFYFFAIRPQMKQQKLHQKMLSELKKGDKVITSGGIWGVVVGISDSENIVVVRIDDNTKIEVSKPYIVGIKKDGKETVMQSDK
ncbi:MAG: preprotein translocase subunit YajC [Candidatus Firestonebacteria bacterium]